jgi:hypothetical protein
LWITDDKGEQGAEQHGGRAKGEPGAPAVVFDHPGADAQADD